MNIEALRHSSSASPVAPHGLDVSGPESDFQQLAETARNVDNIVLWHRVWDKVKFYANEKGLEGSRIKKRTLEIAGGLALIASAAACGEESSAATPSSTAVHVATAAAASASATIEAKTPTIIEPRTATPKAIEIEGPTEEYKAKVREGAGNTIQTFASEISKINIPVDANRKQDMLNDAKLANDSLTSGDVDTAREALLRLKNNVRQTGIGVSSEVIVIPKDLKAQHDPKGKYTSGSDKLTAGDVVINKNMLVDYIAILDILVALDSNY